MKKLLFAFSMLTVLLLLQGCFPVYYRTTAVTVAYDERCWYDGQWVYRFHEGNRYFYRRWDNNSWRDLKHDSPHWQTLKWERKSRADRDDGRRYDDDDREEQKHENKGKGNRK
ncbi:MAG: hypothetical protein WCK36_04345 [Candidatus Firestonebacteria bacterium]